MSNHPDRSAISKKGRSNTLNTEIPDEVSEPRPRIKITTTTPVPKSQHKKEDSTSHTQALNDSSLEISDGSGIMLIEEIAELKKIFEVQSEELQRWDEAIAISKAGSRKMEEFLENAKKDPTESLCDSLSKQIVSFHYEENSRPIISPVPQEFEGSMFASSLMSLSDYQNRFKEIVEPCEPLLTFTSGKIRKTTFKQRALANSHIPGLRI